MFSILCIYGLYGTLDQAVLTVCAYSHILHILFGNGSVWIFRHHAVLHNDSSEDGVNGAFVNIPALF